MGERGVGGWSDKFICFFRKKWFFRRCQLVMFFFRSIKFFLLLLGLRCQAFRREDENPLSIFVWAQLITQNSVTHPHISIDFWSFQTVRAKTKSQKGSIYGRNVPVRRSDDKKVFFEFPIKLRIRNGCGFPWTGFDYLSPQQQFCSRFSDFCRKDMIRLLVFATAKTF